MKKTDMLQVARDGSSLLLAAVASFRYIVNGETLSMTKMRLCDRMSPRHANMVLHPKPLSNEIFGGFIIGKSLVRHYRGTVVAIMLSGSPY